MPELSRRGFLSALLGAGVAAASGIVPAAAAVPVAAPAAAIPASLPFPPGMGDWLELSGMRGVMTPEELIAQEELRRSLGSAEKF